MKNLAWILLAVVILLGAAWLFTGKAPQDIVSGVEETAAISVDATRESANDTASTATEAVGAPTESAAEAVEAAKD